MPLDHVTYTCSISLNINCVSLEAGRPPHPQVAISDKKWSVLICSKIITTVAIQLEGVGYIIHHIYFIFFITKCRFISTRNDINHPSNIHPWFKKLLTNAVEVKVLVIEEELIISQSLTSGQFRQMWFFCLWSWIKHSDDMSYKMKNKRKYIHFLFD